MTALRRAAILVAPLLVIGAFAATSAASIPLELHSCSPGFEFPATEEHWDLSETPDIAVSDACPGALVFTTAALVRPNQVADMRLAGGRLVNVSAISFRMTGPDPDSDLEFGVTCSSCIPMMSRDFPPIGPDGRTRLELPYGATLDLTFFASCSIPAGCVGSAPVELSDFTFEIADDDAPSAGGWVEGHSTGNPNSFFWTSHDWLATELSATDQGLGVMDATLDLSGDVGEGTIWAGQSACRTDAPLELRTAAVCPTGLSAPPAVDLRAAPDGLYRLSMTAHDAVGNQSQPSEVEFGVDRQAPDPPEGLALEGDFGASRWTNKFDVGLAWNQAPDQVEGSSPMKEVRWRLRRSTGYVANSGALSANATNVDVNVPGEGLWEFEVKFADDAGNVGDRSYETFGVDDDAPPPPVLDTLGWVARDDLIAGRSLDWSTPALPADVESGYCGFAVSVDDDPFGSPPVRTDEPAGATAHQLAPRAAGLHFVHVRSVSCANVGSTVATEPLNVDDEAPETSVGGLPAGGWSRNPLSLTVGATDGDGAGHTGSGVASLSYSINGGAPVAVDPSGAVVHVGEGVQVLELNATDAVGNRANPETYVVSVDSVAPNVSVEARSPSAPRQIVAEVTDPGSGVGSVVLQGLSNGEWKPVTSAAAPSTVGAQTFTTAFAVPDDSLPAGIHHLRLVARDVAGNEADFELAPVRLPLRAETRVNARIADVELRCRTASGKRCKSVRRCPRGARCRLTPTVLTDKSGQSVVRPYDVDTALIGEVLGGDGTPVAGVPIDVSSQEFLSPAVNRRTVTTDNDGRFELRLPHGASRDLTVEWAGSEVRLPARGAARLEVRAGVDLKVGSRLAKGGSTSWFSGKVRGAAGRVPPGGLFVRSEFLTDRGWKTFGSKIAVDDRGAFKFSYSWPRRARGGAVQVRAHVDAETAWPYAEGSSDPIKLKVAR